MFELKVSAQWSFPDLVEARLTEILDDAVTQCDRKVGVVTWQEARNVFVDDLGENCPRKRYLFVISARGTKQLKH
jgi:hypothetical protein